MAQLQSTSITGSLIVTQGITAQSLNVQYITSSIVYSSGSNTFGDQTSDNQYFTGSILQSGSLAYFAGSVGIGVTNPNEKLVIQGNGARFKIQTAGDPTVYYTYLESNYNAGNTFNIVDGGSSKFGSKALVTYNDTYVNSYYNVYIATGTADNSSASNIRFFVSQNGNVGIGTVSPIAKLHVSGSSGSLAFNVEGSQGQLFSVTDSLSGSLMSVNDISGLPILEVFSDDRVIAGKFGSNALSVSGSNVGIGAYNPARKLDVYDATAQIVAQFSSSNATSTRIKFSDANTGAENVNVGAIGTRFAVWTNNTERLSILSGGSVGIGSSSPGHALSVLGTVSASAFLGSVTNATSASFAESASNARSAITASSADTFYVRGSIGIGTISPGYKLEVTGNGYFSSTLLANDDLGIGRTPAGNEQFTISVPLNQYAIAFYSGSSLNYGFHTNNGVFNFNGITGSTYNFQSVSVGIGTTVPSGKLHIKSSTTNSYPFLIQRAANTNNIFYVLESSLGDGVATIENSGGGATVQLHSNGTTYFTGGNVGIGTTSPNAALNIVTPSADVTGNAFVFKGSNGKEFVSIAKYGYIRTQASDTNGANMHFVDNGGTKRMEMAVNTTSMTWYSDALSNTFLTFQHSSGNIGIGTQAPLAKLQVTTGTSNADGEGIRLNRPSNGTHYHSLEFATDGTVDWSIGQNSNDSFEIYENGAAATTRLTVREGGNVGIGTTSPGYKLHISGGSEYIEGGFGSNAAVAYTATNRLIFNNDYSDVARGPNKITLYDASWLGGFGIHNDTLGYYSGGTHKWYQATSATNAVLLMSLNSSGNLGVGVLSPAYKLEVLGTVSASAYLGSVTSAVSASFAPNFANTNLSLNGDRTHNVNGNTLTFTATSDESIIFNHSSGGTFEINGSPTIQTTGVLQHQGSGYFTTNIGIGTTVTTTARLHVSASTGTIIRATAAGSDILIVSSSGRVGIGTSNPSTKLHLYEAGASDVIFRITPADGIYDPLIQLTGQGNSISSEGFEMWYVNNVGDVHLSTTYPDAAAAIRFHTATGASKSTSNERMTIAGGGNVGIGSATPAQKLDVNGAIKASLSSNLTPNYVTYNTSTGLMGYAGTGSIVVGTATNADFIYVSTTTSNTDYSLALAVPVHDEYERIYADPTNATYNPSTGTLTVVTLNAQEKSFSIPHQGLPGKKLVYGVLEGPEHSVYVRGKSSERVIELPQEWKWLVDEDSITVSLTSIGEPNAIYVEEIADNRIYVNSNAGTFKYFYHVYATRKDVEPLKTIQ